MRVFNSWGRPGRSLPLFGLLSLPLLLGLATGAQAQVQCTTANSDGSYSVPTDWPLKPSGLAVGTNFRLLFLTSTQRNAASSDIADYNTFVQTRAKAGHSAITNSCGNLFKVVGSTSSISARANTDSESSDTDALIYWLNGAKAADNYADFYDGNWDSVNAKNESGGNNSIADAYTGTNNDGTAHSNPLGSSTPRVGLLSAILNEVLSRASATTNTGNGNFYALSPIFKVAPAITITGGSAVTEGTQANFTVTANPAPSAALSVTVSVADDDNADFVTTALEGNQSISIPTAGSFSRFISTTGDTTDEPDGEVTLSFVSATGYVAGSPSSASVVVKDDDPTIVTLARVGTGAINEGSTVEFTVTLGRALIAGEIIDVPLAVSGTGVTTADWSMALKSGNSINTGVTLSDQTTTTPEVRFSGAGARTATLILTAVSDNTVESGGETYTIALGPNDNTANGFDHSSLGTNVGGGADPSSTASETTFNVTVNDPPTPAVQFASSTATVNESTSTTSVSMTAAPAFTSATNVSYGVTGTATSGTDFTALSGTVSMTGGATAITITITNDAIDEDNETIILTLNNGSGYTVGTRNAVTITITDNDTAGVTISESGTPPSTSVAEDGGTDTYTVVLDTQPSHSVTITPSSGTATAATVSGALTFSTSNWNTAQTVTVTGVNDDVDQSSNRTSTITHAATSSDSDYTISSGISSVTATVVDDDTAGVTITQSSGSTSVPENGGTDTYTVVLNTQPTHSVTITPTSGTTSAATVSGALTFSTSNWNTAQTVTVTGVNDNVDQSGNRSSVISHAASSTDTNYSGISIGSVTATVVDDDGVGVSISKSSVSVAEAGGTDTYTVVLDTQPSHSVTVTPSSGTATAATVSGALTFSTTNWNTAQTVTVTGVDDTVDQSVDRTSTISHSASSSDTSYNSIGISSVTATVVDDDTSSSSDDGDDGGGSMALSFSPSALLVTEGGSNTYTVKLSSEPTGDVTVTITSDNGDVTVDTDSTRAGNQTTLSFTPSNWNQAQAVTVSAVQDADTSDDSAMLTHAASGGGYGSVSGTVNVNVRDVDGAAPPAVSTPPVVSITGSGPISEGDDAHFTLSATPPPGEGDTISVSVSISDSGNVVSPGESGSRSVTIAANGTTSFTVSTQEDDTYEEDGRITATVAAGSGYRPHGSNGSAVVVVEDDDPGLDVSQPSLRVPEGRSTSYTMALATEPTGDVTVTVSISGGEGTGLTTAPSMGGLGRSLRQGGEGTGLTITPTRLVFTPSNWNQEQRVTVTAAESAAIGRTITLSHRASGGGYDGIPLSDVMVRVVSAHPAAAVGGWQLRFGRTVSQQVVDALQQRWSTNPTAGHLTVAGEAISSTTPPPPLAENEGVLSKALGFDPLTLQQVVEDSSFTIAPQPQPQPEIETEAEAEGGAPQLAVWGQGALSSFKGEGNALSSLRGDVTTLLLGADWSTTRWQAGAALSHSWGNGSYAADAGADGDLSSTLTGLFPYGRYGLTPRLAIWAVAGYGWGQLSLQPDGADGDYKPSTTMTMAALGMDGLLLDGGKEGISLTSTAELLTLKSTTAEVEGLDASEGSVSRLRLGLEATRAFPLANGASLLPTMAVGIRQDSGNAETGFGVDVGAGMVWNDPERGIRGEVKGRTLLTHREESFQEQGMAISFSWDPTPSKRGPSLSLSHTMGATGSGGMDALLNPTTMEDASPSSGGQQEFTAEVAYGFPAHRDRLTLTPAVALALSSTSRNYSLLWSLAPYAEQMQTPPWEVALEGERQEQHSPTSAVHHSLKLIFSSLF